MAIVYGANYGRPTLDLNFAKNKSLIDTISGRNLITFTRSQTAREATYVGADGIIKTAAANEPRFDHNPTTGESLGLLVEEARTNRITYSQAIGTGPWTLVELSAGQNAGIAPDGTFTAASLVATTANSRHQVDVFGIAPTNEQYRFSGYFKANGHRYVGFYCNINAGIYGHFDLVDGVANIGTIQSVGNGWYRCVSSQYPAASNNGNNTFKVALGTTNTGFATDGPAFVGDGTSGVLAWGLQSEAGTFPTSYIPTVASTVTRAADVASITGTNFSSWYNQSQGTTLIHTRNINSADYSLAPFIAYDNNDNIWDNNQEYGLRYNFSGTTFEAVVRDSSAGSLSLDKSGDVRASSKAVIALNASQFAYTRDGLTVAQTSTLGPMSTISRLTWSTTAGPRQSFRISRLTYYPVRLPDATLQTLTK
jgi:hypothetical protein